jgi:hypothetical protein
MSSFRRFVFDDNGVTSMTAPVVEPFCLIVPAWSGLEPRSVPDDIEARRTPAMRRTARPNPSPTSKGPLPLRL